MTMNYVSNIIISVGAILLLSVGIHLAISDKVAAFTSILSFAFLFVVLLLLAKFKRIKGFCFEAEMWEEKQEEAAVLVERLTLLSTTVSQQVALIAAKLGLHNGGLTFKETVDLLNNTQEILNITNVPEEKADQILAPLYDRIELNYWNSARSLISHALEAETTKINSLATSPRIQDREIFPQRLDGVMQDEKRLDDISYQEFKKDRSFRALTTFGRSSRSLADATETLHTLEALSLDLARISHPNPEWCLVG